MFGREPTIHVMSGSHPRRTVASLGVAGAGLILGHWLAYAIDTPHAHAREELLRATGHGYLPYATQVGLLAATIGLVGLFVARLGRRGARASFVGNVARLAAAQSAAFITMEIGERLLSDAPLHDLAHGPLLAIGLGVQIMLAVAGAAVLRLTTRAAEVATSLGRSPAPASPQLIAAVAFPSSLVAPRRPAMSAPASRAPPFLP
jgi:hypothetical protein